MLLIFDISNIVNPTSIGFTLNAIPTAIFDISAGTPRLNMLNHRIDNVDGVQYTQSVIIPPSSGNVILDFLDTGKADYEWSYFFKYICNKYWSWSY